MSSLIQKLWYTAWYVWNYINHKLHSPGGPTKTEIYRLINKSITYLFNRVTSGLPLHCQFLLHTSIHTLILLPVRQRLSWISDTSSARICSQQSTTRIVIMDANKIVLERITRGRLILDLTQFDEAPQLFATAGPPPT